MIVAVESTRGPSTIYVEVVTDDEDVARRVALCHIYGCEEEPTEQTLDEMTEIVKPVTRIVPPRR